MNLFERRALTAGEIELGRSVFGEGIEWRAVRVLQGPKLGFGAMVPRGRTILFSNWRAPRDFAATDVGEQAWFVHELAHVWQARRGVVLAGAKLKAMGRKAYDYVPHAGASLRSYNIEQQAEIARHLFLARTGGSKGASGKTPPRDWLESIWRG